MHPALQTAKEKTFPPKPQLICLFILTALLAICNARHISKQNSDISATSEKPQRSREYSLRTESLCFYMCNCSGSTADCSRNYGRLTFVPELPREIRHLNFSLNNLTVIRNDNFFSNASEITSLDIRKNGLRYISRNAFRCLIRLRSLYLGQNKLSYPAARPVLSAIGLKNLYMREMNLGLPRDDFFGRKPLPPLTTIDLTGNLIQHLNFSVFASLTHLSQLWIKSSHIVSTTTAYMRHLTELHLLDNNIDEFPETCRNGSSLFPRLHVLILTQNKIKGLPSDVFLPELYSLDLGKNPISVFKTDMFNQNRFPSLEKLSLTSILPVSGMERFAFRHPNLSRLSLMYCSIPFNKDTIDPESFAGSPRLVYLQVSHNQASHLSDRKFSQLFGSIENLQILYLGNSYLNRIGKHTFGQLRHLTVLHLYGNGLTDIPDGAFDSLANLTNLTLNNNQLSAVRESMLNADLRKHLQQLDLSGNPFVCDCNILWFKEWFVKSSSLFNNSYTTYTCNNIPDTSLELYSPIDQMCLLSHEMSRVIISVISVCIVILLIAFIMYCHRWHIRLMLVFRGQGEIMRRRLQMENFDYDVFVSCAEEDEHWIEQYLKPELEGRHGLRLCFHKRDFIPGKNILNNIVDSVKASKKFLMVFSRHFAQSHWCQFELDLCLGHVMDNEDALIVTCMSDVAAHDLTSTMMAVLQTTTYIQWEENRDVQALFWNRLMLSLREIMQV